MNTGYDYFLAADYADSRGLDPVGTSGEVRHADFFDGGE